MDGHRRSTGQREQQLPAGTSIEISPADGAWHQRHVTGADPAASIKSSRAGYSIVGLSAFGTVDVRYDLATGTVGFANC